MRKQKRIFLTLLPLIDYLAVLASFLGAYYFRDYLNQVYLLPAGQFLKLAAMLSLLWVPLFAFTGLYSFSLKRGSLEELFKIVLGSSAALTLNTAIIYALKEFAFSRLVLIITWLASIVNLWLLRYLIGIIQNRVARLTGLKHRLVIAGDQEGIDLIRKGILALNEPQTDITATYTNLDQALQALESNDIDEIIVITSEINSPQVAEFMQICEAKGISLKLAPNIFQTAGVKAASHDLAGVPLIEVKVSSLEGWSVILKRLMDIFLSTLALIATTPLMALTALAIKLDTPGPIFYRDKRVGRNNREFELIKFRSMKMLTKDGELVHSKEDEEIEKLKAQQKNYKLEHDPRVTRVGHFIRKTSIDELPQFWNILKGEMSLVGPRAYRADELEEQQKRHPETKSLVRRLLTVKPGLTGVWQVSGRSEVEFSERVAMDAYYATNAKLITDLQIILRTIPVVLKGSGAM